MPIWSLKTAVAALVTAAVIAGRAHAGPAVATAGALTPAAITAVLEAVTAKMARRYDMGVSTAFYSESAALGFSAAAPGAFGAAAGHTDAGMGMGTPFRLAQTGDPYVWGSITKMFTGPAVLQLVERGAVDLADPISMHADPLLQHFAHPGLTKLSDHFGDAIGKVQVHHLLHMVSGIPDYDGESYARDQFANRSRAFGAVEIIAKYTSTEMDFEPGTRQQYCSTNYILLGLLLATHYHKDGSAWSWKGYNQRTVLPAALQKAFPDSVFVNAGPSERDRCEDHTMVHGFMQSYSTASLPPQDVWNVSCAGGWTAGNYIGPVGDVGRYTYALYNTENPSVVSKAMLNDHMLNFTSPSHYPFKFYGMGTFSLDWSVGGNQTGYGHVGDTYGYQSQTTYFPAHDFVLTIATNVETSTQAQPADFTCSAYNELVAAIRGTPAPDCTFTVPRSFIGTCSCEPSK